MTDGSGPSQAVEVAVAVPVRDGKLLVARRRPGTHLAGLWEFPGGKIELGEAPAGAAGRELREETGLEAGRLEPLLVAVHEYPERSVRLHVFLARAVTGDVRMDPPREWAWRTPEEAQRLDMPEANAQILSALRWRIR